MSGSAMTFTETNIAQSSIKKIKAAWTSDSSGGTASGTTTGSYAGRFIGLITVPGTAGYQPSDNYTVTIVDSDSVDLLLGAASANRDQTNTEYIAEASMSGVAESTLTFAVSGAGNSKKGTIYLLIR